MSEIAIAQGDYQTGANYKTEVLGIVREQDNPAKEAVTLNSLGLLAGRQQEYGQARAYLEQALTLYQTVGNRRGESVAINNLGIIAHILGEYNQAHRYYQHSLMISREIGSRQEEAIILNNLGEVSAKQGNHLTAKTHYEQCLILEKRIGMRSFEAHTLRVYGETLLALASVAESKDKFTQAINLHKELKQEGMHLLPARLGLAQINQTLGNIQQAISELNAILEDLSSQTLDGLGDPLGFYWNCFILMQKLNDERAIDILTKAYHLLLDQAQKIEDPMSRRSFLENVPEHRLIVETASINS
ncbi:MAG: hypothetical protein DHS20C20_30160 [Ardenticatenaceae bacterium]|nr:MAG: hypothetical protein DHS20C20_30160 [Ardenticatenaceae bacterium]